jgi:hypothetical protein
MRNAKAIKANFTKGSIVGESREDFGMSKKAFARLEHAGSIGEACELTLACEGNIDVPADSYYDVKLADGTEFEAVSGIYFDFEEDYSL